MKWTLGVLRPLTAASPLLVASLLLAGSGTALAAPAKAGKAKLAAAKPAAAKRAVAKPGPTNDDCLGCHGDKSAARADGRPVFVLPEVFAASIHGEAGLACTDCHQDLAHAELPHGEKLAAVSCSGCHEKPTAEYQKGVHAAARKKATEAHATPSLAATCIDCHGMHDIRPARDPKSPTNHFNVPTTCLKCHANPKIAKGLDKNPENLPLHFKDSIHGRALSKSGLAVAPNCVSCHGVHEVRPRTDPESKVFRAKVPATCGSCHTKILDEYSGGVHGLALAKGNPKAPVCSDCHSTHEVRDIAVVSWQLAVIKECGTCHVSSIHSYRDTYHGKVTSLGFTRVATCASCHGAHEIFGPKDPRSMVSAEHRVETCTACHPGVGANFAKYDPHADPQNQARNPFLYLTAKFMKILLIGVFAFFGLHTALWIPRSFQVRRGSRKGGDSK
jgi:hypothetical protein